jgi:hypothetical protein
MTHEKKRGAHEAKKALKTAAGAVVILFGVALTLFFFQQLKDLIAGAVGPLLILAGLVTVAIAKE